MQLYDIGQKVIAGVNSAAREIIFTDSSGEDKKITAKIIGYKDPWYTLLVTDDMDIVSWEITTGTCERYGIQEEYIGQKGWRTKANFLRKALKEKCQGCRGK